jgi:chromosome segregation ATPase
MKYSGYVYFMIFLFLAGCASSSHDPREGGLFGGIQGLQSGAYQQRISDRESSLERLRAVQEELEAESSEIETQKRTLEEQIAQDRLQLAGLEKEVSELDRILGALEADDTVQDQRIKELQTRLGELKKEMGVQMSALDALEGSGTGNIDVDLRRRQLKEQRRMLQQEFELLFDLSMELAR